MGVERRDGIKIATRRHSNIQLRCRIRFNYKATPLIHHWCSFNQDNITLIS